MPSTITRGQRLVLAAVCAVAVSTIYAIQPVLESAGGELGLAGPELGRLVAAGQLGYFAGLVLLVPLGDVLDRRTLIVGHLILTGTGAAITSLAPGGVAAGAGLALAGLFAVVVQITVAYVAATSPPGSAAATSARSPLGWCSGSSASGCSRAYWGTASDGGPSTPYSPCSASLSPCSRA